MRIVIFAIAIVFVCFSSRAQADITYAYNGHGADFRWSPNTVLGPTVKVAGSVADTPGSGLYILPVFMRDSFQELTLLDGSIRNSVSKSSDSVVLTQFINESFDSNRVELNNMQFDNGQYTYYAFTVTETSFYDLTFTADANFFNSTYPIRSPSYNFAGTDSVFNFYEYGSGPQNPLAKFSHSAGAAGTNDNHAFNTGLPFDYTTNALTQRVLLEAGKLYQADIYSYSYIGGAGRFSSGVLVNNSLSIVAVPEPASLAILASTLSYASLQAYRRRRKGNDVGGDQAL